MNKGKQKIISLFVLIAIVFIIILCLISCQERKAQSESAMNDDTLTFETSKEEVEAIKEEVESKEEREKEFSSVKVSSDSSASMDSSSSFTNNSTAGNSSTVNNSSTTSSANNEESTTGTSSDIDAEESTAAPVVESNNSNTNSSTPANSSVPTNSSTSTNNSTPATESSTPATNSSTTESSTPTNSSTPATESSTATQTPNCNHAWASRLVVIHHEATYTDEPIYGTKQGIVEEAWDEIIGYEGGYRTSDGVIFSAAQYNEMKNYCHDNNTSWNVIDIPIFIHHDSIIGEVPDYDNIIGYDKVEMSPAWDEEGYEYYCTKCGEKL